MIKAIIFDFGRVISSQKPQSLFHTYEIDLGLPPNSINQTMFSSPFWQEAMLGRKTGEDFWYAIGPELGLKTPEKIDEFRRRYHSDESINEAVVNLIRKLLKRCLGSDHGRKLPIKALAQKQDRFKP